MDSSDKSTEINDAYSASAKLMRLHAFGFLLVCVLPFALALDLTRGLFTLIFENETFSQIPLIPLVSILLVYVNRKAIFEDVSFGRIWGESFISGKVSFSSCRESRSEWPENAVAFALLSHY
jgi:hypothetical protein